MIETGHTANQTSEWLLCCGWEGMDHLLKSSDLTATYYQPL